ncbi:MAG: HAD family phosphatase [Albidovulum sp.]
MAKPEAVIFDIGNVLIEWRPERFFDRIMGPGERARMFAAIDLHQMNDRIDRGAPFRQTVYDWADRYPEWTEMIRLWHDNWADIAAPAISQSVRLLGALRRAAVPVFVLSNISVETMQIARSTYPFLGEFDRYYVSGAMKVAKPDPEIFTRVESDCRIAPDRLLFVDDRQENIDAAAACGWQVHRFDGPRAWAARLAAEGLLTQEDIT